MKWVKTIVLFDQGDLVSSSEWGVIHESYVEAIRSIKHPAGSDICTIRQRFLNPKKGGQKWCRNGVGFLRNQFFKYLTDVKNWKGETPLDFDCMLKSVEVEVTDFPSQISTKEPIATGFGNFDFTYVDPSGLITAIEWETGNISSSHRSMNKLCLCLHAGIIQIGILIVPSRDLYPHLTDRIGNITELSGYLRLWQNTRTQVRKGLLAITVVEHDALSTSEDIPLLSTGNDGRAQEHRAKQEESNRFPD